jgi:hypothetical protein
MVQAPQQLQSVTREERAGWRAEVIKRMTNMDVMLFKERGVFNIMRGDVHATAIQ